MQDGEARRLLDSARSGVLGTVDRELGTHLVPVVYTPVGEARVVIAVDSKPKRSRRLRRVANVEIDPRVSLLVDGYDDDWQRLWWVRADGRAVIRETIEADVERRHRQRYPQLEGHLLGPWIDIEIGSLTGWSAT